MSEGLPVPESVKIKETSDPKEFMDAFMVSDKFLNGIHKRDRENLDGWNDYIKKTSAANATKEEKKQVYLESDAAKQLLLYFDKEDMRLRYDPAKYPPEIIEKIDSYADAVQLSQDVADYPVGTTAENQAAIIEADRRRNNSHNDLARTLCEAGIVASDRLGRMYARLILIDKGLDTFDGASAEGRGVRNYYRRAA